METQFVASLADTASAIKVGSDGMKIQLDIPETEIGEASKLIDMRRRALTVTITVSPAAPTAGAPAEK